MAMVCGDKKPLFQISSPRGVIQRRHKIVKDYNGILWAVVAMLQKRIQLVFSNDIRNLYFIRVRLPIFGSFLRYYNVYSFGLPTTKQSFIDNTTQERSFPRGSWPH